MTLIQLDQVSVSFGDRHILRELNLEIDRGEHTLILGPSGSGKSTLLYLLGALMSPTSGQLNFERQPYPTPKSASDFRKRNFGFLFQDFHLIEHMTVEDNIGLFQAALGAGKSLPTPRELLTPLGMETFLGTRVQQLSRGERQRVAMARALSHAPIVALADEPTASLDPGNASDTLQHLWGLCAQLGTTAIIVSHDVALKTAPHFKHSLRLEQGALFDTEASEGHGNE